MVRELTFDLYGQNFLFSSCPSCSSWCFQFGFWNHTAALALAALALPENLLNYAFSE